MERTLFKYSALASMLAISFAAEASKGFTFDGIVDEKGKPVSRWLEHNEAFAIVLSDQLQPNSASKINRYKTDAQFQILIGETEVTSLFEWRKNHLSFSGDAPLPSGESELVINQLVGSEWVNIGSTSIQILTSAGFKQASWTPRLELSINSQLDESPRGDSTESQKTNFH